MRRLAAVLLAPSIACASPEPRAAPDGATPACSVGVEVDTRGWHAVVDDDFTFRLPPGFTEDEVQGIDSKVRQWSHPDGRTLMFDYGWYSSTLEEFRSNPDASECAAQIGARAATIASARGFADDPDPNAAWLVGATWRELQGGGDGSPSTHLTMVGRAADRAGLEELAAAMRSTTFQLDD